MAISVWKWEKTDRTMIGTYRYPHWICKKLMCHPLSLHPNSW